MTIPIGFVVDCSCNMGIFMGLHVKILLFSCFFFNVVVYCIFGINGFLVFMEVLWVHYFKYVY